MQALRQRLWGAGLVAATLVFAVPTARADVVTRTEYGFVVRLASEVTSPPADAWKAILTPAQWWQGQHTFSGDAANLTLDPQVGGCFCEVLPRPEGAPATQKPGGVQHMRVIYFEPPRAMRLSGALGPLQSEALAATLTITVKATDKGSRILFEYVVGGFMRYKVDDIAPAVDRMLTAQLASLAGKLGPVVQPVAAPEPKVEAPVNKSAPDGELPASEPGANPVAPLAGAENYSLPPSGAAAEKPAPKAELKAEPKEETKSAPPQSSTMAKPAPKPAVAAPAKPAAKPASKSPSKPAQKPTAKAPDPELDAHRDANAAFDAALGTAPHN